MKIKISVIIPTYNRQKSLDKTIKSFVEQNFDKAEYEIIISDNNSTDKTEEIVRNWMSQKLVSIIYFFEKRQGVHYARNSAAKIAKGDILYFTDDDMMADSNLLKEIISVFEINEKIGCATGKVLPMWEVPPPPWVPELCNNGFLSLQDLGESAFVNDKDMGIWSCHQAIKKEAFIKSGGFNPENTAGTWIGDGETGLNIKIKQAGFIFAYNGKAIIYHCIPSERMTQAYLNKRLANQGSSDSYTYYKMNIYSTGSLVKNILFNKKRYVHFLYLAFRQYLTGDIQWHINFARTSYCIARIKYDLRLIFSPAWRNLVMIDDWLNR